jgi:hypothetical protein
VDQDRRPDPRIHQHLLHNNQRLTAIEHRRRIRSTGALVICPASRNPHVSARWRWCGWAKVTAACHGRRGRGRSGIAVERLMRSEVVVDLARRSTSRHKSAFAVSPIRTSSPCATGCSVQQPVSPATRSRLSREANHGVRETHLISLGRPDIDCPSRTSPSTAGQHPGRTRARHG